MDTANLWFTLLSVCGLWILSLAINCDWTTEYEYEGKCCQACPSGEYPEQQCSKSNSDSVCKKCPTGHALDNWKCFCEEKLLCTNNKCSECESRQICKPGYQMMRVGNFDYTYSCEPCPNQTYNDIEGGLCKPIATCDGLKVVFAGNTTHNARCDSYGVSDSAQNSNPSNIIMVCLTIAVIFCLVLVMYTTVLHFKRRRPRKLFQSCRHRVISPTDACNCKLSKEEMGDETDSKTTLEISLKCEDSSFS